jgi:signal transduction histidine kinase
MTLPAKPNLTLDQALAVIARLQSAAPPSTAALLERVSTLMQGYAEENSYLSAIFAEHMSIRGVPPPTSTTEVTHVIDLDLISGLSDALRTPLIAIRGRAELVEAGLLGHITEEQSRWLHNIQENTDRAFSVLDSVHQMIVLRSGKLKLVLEDFISADLVWEAQQRVREKAKERGQELIVSIPDIVPRARGDFYQSLVILTDLLDNAIHYTPESGQIRVGLDDLGENVLFTVADNGIGLTPEDMENVGLPFWRGEHHYLVRQHLGTGLRLYLARQILMLQGGEFIFSGVPDLGSTFSFTLPKS